MLDQDRHLSDQELLLAADGELPARRAAQIREHLASCWGCRTRMGEIESTIADFVRDHHHNLDPRLPSAAGPRALLKARLAELARSSRPTFWQRLPRFAASGFTLAYVSALFVVALAGGWAYERFVVRGSLSAAIHVDPVAVPKPNLTPGAVRPVTVTDVCSVQSDVEDRSIPVPVQQRVFQEYGIPNARPADYEVDYLITPELGGATDIRNLWPEPHSSTAWNSYVKDDLENRLHQLVCQGKVPLPVAQHDIATNWISAYKKYFHTNRPVTRQTQFDTGRHHGGPRLTRAFLCVSTRNGSRSKDGTNTPIASGIEFESPLESDIKVSSDYGGNSDHAAWTARPGSNLAGISDHSAQTAASPAPSCRAWPGDD